jgi:hypothetical protein
MLKGSPMPTLQLQLLYHAIRRCAPLEYELVAYFQADHPLPRREIETPPGPYPDLAATLIEVAALPTHGSSAIGLTVEQPRVRIYGRRVLLRQRIRQSSAAR